jgi:hypothetical protein
VFVPLFGFFELFMVASSVSGWFAYIAPVTALSALIYDTSEVFQRGTSIENRGTHAIYLILKGLCRLLRNFSKEFHTSLFGAQEANIANSSHLSRGDLEHNDLEKGWVVFRI